MIISLQVSVKVALPTSLKYAIFNASHQYFGNKLTDTWLFLICIAQRRKKREVVNKTWVDERLQYERKQTCFQDSAKKCYITQFPLKHTAGTKYHNTARGTTAIMKSRATENSDVIYNAIYQQVQIKYVTYRHHRICLKIS